MLLAGSLMLGGSPALAQDTDLGALTGSVTSDGSSTVGPLTQAVAEDFIGSASNVQISVDISGTGGGFKRFCDGEIDVQNASRAIKEEEAANCATNGVDWYEFEVAYDGITIVTPEDELVPGGEIEIEANGFEANEPDILVVVYSDPIVLDRQAGANANGTHAYGAPVVIVGPGVGKDVWAGLGTDPGQTCVDRWTIADGVLTNGVPARGERSTCNPYTKQKFNDFRFEMEFNLGAGQNSGLYLRGRYELQMALQAEGARTPAYPGLLMDIYGWKRADVYAGNPPDQWQILEGVLVGNRVTATLNGKRVHDNALIPAITGGAMDNDELAPGPIMIQGDHSKVSIRKLVITPIQGR